MTNLSQLLDNFYIAVFNRNIEDSEHTELCLKAAQEAIVAHVEGAMVAAMVHGKVSAKGANMGEAWEESRADAWDDLVKRWV